MAAPRRGSTCPWTERPNDTDTPHFLADDHALVRRGVRLILDDSPGLCVVAEASDGAEAVTLARAEDVDLAILDVVMPRLAGL
jgi:YesN/AraC family two-component response regulator